MSSYFARKIRKNTIYCEFFHRENYFFPSKKIIPKISFPCYTFVERNKEYTKTCRVEIWMVFTFKPSLSETELDKTPVKILEVLKEHPEFTLAEVAGQIGKSTSAVERASQKLVREGKLQYIGP